MTIPEIASRYLSPGEIFRVSFHIFRLRYPVILGIVIAFNAPVDVLLAFLPDSENIFLHLTAGILVSMLRLPVPIVIALIVEGWMNGEAVPASEAFEKALSKWIDATWVHILQTLATMLGFVLLIVPGIIIAVFYMFCIQVVALRGERGKRALNYSFSLVGWQWWRVFGIVFVIFLFTGVPTIFASLAWYGPKNAALLRMLPHAISYVLSPFAMIALTIFFLNMDYMKNGPPQEEQEEPGEPVV